MTITHSVPVIDVSRLEAKLGPSRVPWRDGIRRMVEARNPELLRAGV